MGRRGRDDVDRPGRRGGGRDREAPEDRGNPNAELRERMNERLDRVDERLDRMDERLDRLQERVRQLLEGRGN